MLSEGLHPHRAGNDVSALLLFPSLCLLTLSHSLPVPITRDPQWAKMEKYVSKRSIPKSDYFFAAKDGEALYNQQKQDQELTVAQISYSYHLTKKEKPNL